MALSSIVLSREIHPAADLGLGPLTVRRTPLVAEGTQVVPSGSTLFRKVEGGWFYFEIYAPDSSSVRVRVRVLDKNTGQSRWDSGVTKLPIPANGGKAFATCKLQAATRCAHRGLISARNHGIRCDRRDDDPHGEFQLE